MQASRKLAQRKNADLALLHSNSAQLLKRIADSHGHPSARDCAMAGIYASQLEKRKKLS